MEPYKFLLYWIYSSFSLFVNVFSSDFLSPYDHSHKHISQNCSFPAEWQGRWFENGLADVKVTAHRISHVGHCFSHDGLNKYLLLNSEDTCFICLAFTPKHRNLIQYKRSYCVRTNDIKEVCDMITGDFPLHTMVKVPGSPIPCPFQGHYSFSYTNGSEAKCDNPQSSIQACADPAEFQFHHHKCQNIPNTYDKVESFQCLATWDNGMDHYLYGRFTGGVRTSRESQYRCFMYSIYGSYGAMSMTADATCQGLQAPNLGMNVYNLMHEPEKWPQPRCQFPDFFGTVSEWRDVNGREKFFVNKREDGFTVLDIANPGEEGAGTRTKFKVSCIGEVDSVESGRKKTVEVLAYVTNADCESKYRCIRFTQRTDKVVDIQMGGPTEQTEFVCQDSFFVGAQKQVLIPYETAPTACPMPGVYSYVQKDSECHGQLDIGCSRDSEIVVDGKCLGAESADVLQCYANWTESDRVYVIAGRVGDPRKAADCLVYRVTVNGYELDSDPACGSERLTVLGRPVEFIIKSPSKSCSASTTRPSPVYPAQSQESRDQTGIYDTNRGNKGIHSSEIIETPPGGGKKTSGVINANNSSSGSWVDPCLLFLGAVLSAFVTFTSR